MPVEESNLNWYYFIPLNTTNEGIQNLVESIDNLTSILTMKSATIFDSVILDVPVTNMTETINLYNVIGERNNEINSTHLFSYTTKFDTSFRRGDGRQNDRETVPIVYISKPYLAILVDITSEEKKVPLLFDLEFDFY